MEHAATAEQCEADVQTWNLDLQSPAVIKQLSYSKIYARAIEMWNCGTLAQSRATSSQNHSNLELAVRNALLYHAVAGEFETYGTDRLVSFISRHDSASQIAAEHVPILSFKQEPQPMATTKLCQADSSLWNEQNKAGLVDKMSADELYLRWQEANACLSKIQGTNLESLALRNNYILLAEVYEFAMSYRIRVYMRNHNETDQFASEDAAGVR